MARERKKAVVAFSFGGGREKEGFSGVSNIALATALLQFRRENPDTLSIAQWEIDEASPMTSKAHHAIFRHVTSEQYLDSEEVAKQAIEFIKSKDSYSEWEIFIVAHPFLHRSKCMKLFPGFSVKAVPTGKIGFDKQSIYWWCRGPIRLLLYAVMQVLTGRRGK